MRTDVTVISDTHWRHEELQLPPGDLLIHCGDMLNQGGRSNSLAQMDEWFGKQRFELILCTGANHDHELEFAVAQNAQPFKNAHFVSDELLEFRGLRIYGAPWVPNLPTHAFFKDVAALARSWSAIPATPDILITHTPPKGILDRSSSGRSYGCEALSRELARAAPRVHCFGHVHASAGCSTIDDTLFINASSVESQSDRMRPPVMFSLSPRTTPTLTTLSKPRRLFERFLRAID